MGGEALKISYDAGLYPYPKKMPRDEYEATKAALQVELLKVQEWYMAQGKKISIVFEGRDTAGKGGTIKRFMEHLNPRHARVVALSKPSEVERGQWYFQRYVGLMPTDGEMALFDRSWYNRAGVERVMGFCTPQEYLEFLRQAPELERMLVRSGMHLFKYWLTITKEMQQERFQARKENPLKRWKLSPIDLAAMDHWDDYTEAKEAMFFHTNTADSPWITIKANDKRRARINCMRHFLSSLDYTDKDTEIVAKPDPLIVGDASQQVNYDDHSLISRAEGKRK